MRKIIYFFLFLSLQHFCHAQGGIWTWVNGDSTTNSPGNRGAIGSTNNTNYPSGRYQAAQWTDLDGNFWIFGGNDTNYFTRNDLWKYNPNTNEWTWVNGPDTTGGLAIYGTQGIPGPNNVPGARCFGMRTWTDQQGRLWLYGGAGYGGALDDVWMYDIPTNQWTWMKGEDTGNVSPVYGNLGIPSPYNTPGGRTECNTSWVKSDGTFWTFGGGQGVFGSGYNDVWRFDPGINMWTWMSGPMNTNSQYNYGTLNVEAATNLPPARWSYSNWRDANDNFYIFGGLSMFPDSSINNIYNDVWKYNTSNNLWTWIAGSSLPGDMGSYTEECNTDNTTVPSARYENRTVQTNICTTVFWTFGWQGNALLAFLPQSLRWIWVSGDSVHNLVGNYGSINVAASTNQPPGRLGECFWADRYGTLWMWGGAGGIGGGAQCSDMWKFVPDLNCFHLGCDTNVLDSFTMPTAFTPNGDNKNDLFYPVFTYQNDTSVVSFSIYNRWGLLVYNNPTQGWDGTYKGEPQPEGIYTYFITVDLPYPNNPGQKKEARKQGSFALIR